MSLILYSMIKKISVVSMLLLVTACTSDDIETHEAIDLKSLERLEVEEIIDIGESEDYIPGQLRDLILTSDGTMLVSDRQKTTIEQFTANGDFIGTIAGEGNGPGELTRFFLLKEFGNDTLIVRQILQYKLDFFSRERDEDTYQYDHSVKFENFERPASLIGHHSEGIYYATTSIEDLDGHWANAQIPVVLINKQEVILEDSLHLLKTPQHLRNQIETGGVQILGIPPYQYRDRFIYLENGRYMIARPDSSALFLYNSSHELEQRIDLNVSKRRVESNDLDYLLRNKDREVQIRMRERVPEFKPPFLDIWLSEKYIWLHTDTDKAGKEIVVLTMSADPIGKFNLPEESNLRYFRDKRIYTLYSNQENGHRIRIYQVEI